LDQDHKRTEPDVAEGSRSWEQAMKREPTATRPWEGEQQDL